jgi:uncharacterized protein YegP (UPF0339 family)
MSEVRRRTKTHIEFLRSARAMATFEIYKDKKGEFRWRLKASNGLIIATSGEGYVAKADCQHGIELLKSDAAKADVKDSS